MKSLCFIFLFGLLVVSCEKEQQLPLSLNKKADATHSSESKLPKELEKEDCDDKLEKAQQAPAEISLDGAADQGCSIEDL